MISYRENCPKQLKIGIFGGFLKKQAKPTSPNPFGLKMKFFNNEERNLHTKFHEYLMNFNRSDKNLKKIIDNFYF